MTGKKLYLIAGTYTHSQLPNIGTLDLEAYLLAVLAKNTCCTKTLFSDSATITTLTTTDLTTTTVAATTGTFATSVDTASVIATSITEKTAGAGIIIGKQIIRKHTTVAHNATLNPVPASSLLKGYITSTSAAAVTLTLDTATNLATGLGAVQGTVVDFYIDNSAGASTVTLAVNTGITAATPVITGGGTLTVSVANAVGIFRLVFTSATAAKLYRIG